MRLRPTLLLAATVLLNGLVHAGDHGKGKLVQAPPEPAAGLSPGLTTLDALQEQEQKTRAELDRIGKSEQDQKKRLVVRGRVVYRLMRVGFLPAGGGFDDFVRHAIRLGKARRALDEDLAQAAKLSERKALLRGELDEIATRKAPLELEREAAQRARALLDEADDRRRSFERAFETSTGAGDYVAVYGGGVGPDDPSAAVDGFRAMRGRLPFPLAGRAEVRIVHRQGANGPGVEMSALLGSAVRAVFSGRVAFADRYDPFGSIVILDHGDRYYTLMGNLGAMEVRVGDDLSAGARVGTVGQGPNGPMLYFEIRKAAATLDPKPWLGL
jgi:murein DD-endopeptidase MepM/ murein hydrolase activator NlpD